MEGYMASNKRVHNGRPSIRFNHTGRVLNEAEKAKACKSKGWCPGCGVQTHVGNKALRRSVKDNPQVWHGICILCQPHLVPTKKLQERQSIISTLKASSIQGSSTTSTTRSSSGMVASEHLNSNSSSQLRPQQQSLEHKMEAEAFRQARRKVHVPTSAKRQVMESWDLVKDDLDQLGMTFFLTVFERYPQVKDLFPLGRLETREELQTNKFLTAHASMVMNTVGHAVAGLSDMENLLPTLRELGHIHTLVGVKPEHYDVIYLALIDTIKQKVGQSRWTRETQQAWELCYSTMTSVMKDPTRYLTVEAAEGWGLFMNGIVSSYLAISTPYYMAFSFGATSSSTISTTSSMTFIWWFCVSVVLRLMDCISIAACLLDLLSNRLQSAIKLRTRTHERSPQLQQSKGYKTILYQRYIFPVMFRVNRLIRRLRLSHWASWPLQDTAVLLSFGIQVLSLSQPTNSTYSDNIMLMGMVRLFVVLLRCTSVVRVVHLVRSAELISLKRFNMRREHFHNIHFSKLLLMFAYMIHLFGSFYCIIALLEANTAFGNDLALVLSSRGDWINGYLHAVYWAFVNVAGIGNHSATPETSLQIIFSMIVHLVGATFYAVAAGSVFTILEGRIQSNEQITQDMADLTSFLEECQVPQPIQDKFLSSYLMRQVVGEADGDTGKKIRDDENRTQPIQQHQHDEPQKEQEILTSTRPLLPEAAQVLPTHLKMELNLFSRAKALRTRGIPSASEEFAFFVAESLSDTMTLLPGDYLFQVGHRVTQRVIMVDKGVLEIFASDGVSKGRLYPGDVIGLGWLGTQSMESTETAIRKAYLDWRSLEGLAIASIRAMTDCRLVMGLGNRHAIAHLSFLCPHDMKQVALQCDGGSSASSQHRSLGALHTSSKSFLRILSSRRLRHRPDPLPWTSRHEKEKSATASSYTSFSSKNSDGLIPESLTA